MTGGRHDGQDMLRCCFARSARTATARDKRPGNGENARRSHLGSKYAPNRAGLTPQFLGDGQDLRMGYPIPGRRHAVFTQAKLQMDVQVGQVAGGLARAVLSKSSNPSGISPPVTMICLACRPPWAQTRGSGAARSRLAVTCSAAARKAACSNGNSGARTSRR